MPRVIITTNLPPSGEAPVLLDEHLSTVHLSSDHSAAQLIERLSWAVRDAEEAERRRVATRPGTRRAARLGVSRAEPAAAAA